MDLVPILGLGKVLVSQTKIFRDPYDGCKITKFYSTHINPLEVELVVFVNIYFKIHDLIVNA